MKKLVSIMLILVLILSSATVGKTNSNCPTITIASTEKVYAATKTLNNLVSYLESKKLLSGEKTKMAASLIGAKTGVKYSDIGVELYEYNTSSKVYKNILKTKKVTLKDFNMDLKVSGINGKFIIIFDDNPKNKNKILKAFKAF